MRRLTLCALLTLAFAVTPSVAAASEDREQFCQVIADSAKLNADDRRSKMFRIFGDQLTALEMPLADIIAANGRAVDSMVLQCRPDLADGARMRG